MGTLKERLTELRAEHPHITQASLANTVGITQASVSDWFTGKTKSLMSDTAAKVAPIYGVTVRWLATGEGHKYIGDQHGPIDPDTVPGLVPIRTVKLQLHAGQNTVLNARDEDDGEILYFHVGWLHKCGYQPQNLLAVKVPDESMEPTLFKGDTILIHTLETNPQDGRAFALNYEGELMVKRLVRDSGQWWAASDNPDKTRYPRKVMGDGCLIVGRVVWKASRQI